MYALKKYYLIIFLIFLTAEVYSQSVTCSYCGKKITGKYLVVDGKAFHPEHFICGKCGKPIEGAYQKFGLKYYHSLPPARFNPARYYAILVPIFPERRHGRPIVFNSL